MISRGRKDSPATAEEGLVRSSVEAGEETEGGTTEGATEGADE